MKVTNLILPMILIAGASFTVITNDPWPVPDKYAKMANPVKSDAASIATGKELWAKHCQSCHSLAFEPKVTSRQVPHGSEAGVMTVLREFYARLVLGDVPPGVVPPPDLQRVRPGLLVAPQMTAARVPTNPDAVAAN